MIKVNGKFYNTNEINFLEYDSKTGKLNSCIELTCYAESNKGIQKCIKATGFEYEPVCIQLIKLIEEYTN